MRTAMINSLLVRCSTRTDRGTEFPHAYFALFHSQYSLRFHSIP